jgi:hypothetical protein
MGQYQTFIVRFWTEETAEVARGHIQHVATGRGLYFRDLERMLRFINDHLEVVSIGPAAPETATEGNLNEMPRIANGDAGAPTGTP